MDKAFFLNGVFESVLTEIIESCSNGKTEIAYLQPYSTSVAKFLKENHPSSENPITGYFSTTKGLSEVTYIAEIIGWEDKRELSEQRKLEVETALNNFQPDEGGLYLINDKGEQYANLITISNLRKLNRSIPVTNLTKISDGRPHGIRSQAGGWSTVYLIPSENDDMPSFTEKQIKRALNEGLVDSMSLSRENRQNRLAQAERQPPKIQIISTGYSRNSDVIAEVLVRANGICERCGNPAPFNRTSDGSPYLEVHHIQHLAEGGDDTIVNAQALCPNCHREMHFGLF